jgi:hypothetical protein
VLLGSLTHFFVALTMASIAALIASGRSAHASTMSRRSAGSASGTTTQSEGVTWGVTGGRAGSLLFASVRDDDSWGFGVVEVFRA